MSQPPPRARRIVAAGNSTLSTAGESVAVPAVGILAVAVPIVPVPAVAVPAVPVPAVAAARLLGNGERKSA
jgi:hypothetical protein